MQNQEDIDLTQNSINRINKKKASAKRNVKRGALTHYMKQNLFHYIVGGFCLFASTSLDVWLPLITAAIVDDVIVAQNLELLPRLLCDILIVGFGRGILQYVKDFVFDMAGCNVAENMRKDLLHHIQGLSRSFFDKNNTGELMARVKDDEGRIWDMTGFCGMLIIEAIFYLLAVVFCMIRMSWKLSLIPIVFLPIIGFAVIRLEQKLDKMYGDISEENATLTRTIEENISGVRTVKAFAAEQMEMKKFDDHNQHFNNLNVEQARYMAKMEPLIGLIPKIMQVMVLAVGGFFVIQGEITYGILVAFIQYSGNIVWPIENMGWLTNMFAAGIASYKKIRKVFDAEPTIVEADDATDLASPHTTLTFDHVGFSLNDTAVLSDVSFELTPGKTIGIMGATGSGKTTIVNLIQRFYDVSEGSILLGGTDIRSLTLKSLRSYASVVTQDIFLFSDTIRENVKLGKKASMPEKTVKYAVETAHAAEFVDKLTGGYDAVIGERGIGLSGGQKQRLSIARALAKDAGVLIMDDSTSALDMETEADIQKEIRSKKDLSKIIIAHRISSVKDADEILVLDKGRVAERGTHESLLAQKGIYYSTYEAQFGSLQEAMKWMGGEK